MQIEENLIVCFSDNSYDNCNPTRRELSFVRNEDKKKFWYRQVCSYFQVGLETVTEEFLLSENYFMYKKKRYKSKQDGLNCLLTVKCRFGVKPIQ